VRVMSQDQDLKTVSDKFGSLLRAEFKNKKKDDDAMRVLSNQSDAIKEARALKISYFKINELLRSLNVKSTPALVKDFCIKKLGEVPVTRKRRKKSTKSSVVKVATTTTPPKTLTKRPEPLQQVKSVAPAKTKSTVSKNGFRVAENDL